MHISKLQIPDLLLIELDVFSDERGAFFESFNKRKLEVILGENIIFVQDNHSKSYRNVLRGLHFQSVNTQGKLIRVLKGEIFDVSVDMRRTSATFGKWVGINLSSACNSLLWIPEGFAHGFITISAESELLYKTTNYWSPTHEQCLIWNDPTVGIEWPIKNTQPILSLKDQAGIPFHESNYFD